MRKVKIKIPAKINLTLDVLGVKNGYHVLKSLVTSVNVYDTITVVKRKDRKITLTEKGVKCECKALENNALRAGKLFMDKFNVGGVDIILNKSIPVGGGMGGSSADIAGVLLCMQKLFGVSFGVKDLADELGSDSGYMLDGGWAIISERGERVEKIDYGVKLYLLAVTEKSFISARECFKTFDERAEYVAERTEVAAELLKEGNVKEFLSTLKNDLTESAISIIPSIRDNLSALKSFGAVKTLMTGSGSVAYGIFESKKERNAAYKKMLPIYGKRLIKAETL